MLTPLRRESEDGMNEPILTMDQVKNIILGSMTEQFEKACEGWDSPVKKIMAEIISENTQSIKDQFTEALQECFADKEFMKIVKQEFKHKVAKNLVGKLEGEVEKAVAVLRQDPTLRSRMILAIEKIVNEV